MNYHFLAPSWGDIRVPGSRSYPPLLQIAALAFVFLFLATFSADADLNRSVLKSNKAKWEQAGISAYTFKLHVICFCGFLELNPLSIEVKDRDILSITPATRQRRSEFDSNFHLFSQYATIDRLFGELQSEFAASDEVIVTYDPTYGFPAKARFDRSKRGVDDEVTLEITDFKVRQVFPSGLGTRP